MRFLCLSEKKRFPNLLPRDQRILHTASLWKGKETATTVSGTPLVGRRS